MAKRRVHIYDVKLFFPLKAKIQYSWRIIRLPLCQTSLIAKNRVETSMSNKEINLFFSFKSEKTKQRKKNIFSQFLELIPNGLTYLDNLSCQLI